MFWLCPGLEKYWREVFQILCIILNVDLEPNPVIGLSGNGRGRCAVDPNQVSNAIFGLCWPGAVLLSWRDAAPPTQLYYDLFKS